MLITKPEFSQELLRKSLHVLIAAAVPLSSLHGPATAAILLAGTALYIIAEKCRQSGIRIPLISFLTEKSSRIRDQKHFVWGPCTLGLGAAVTILVFPAPAAASAIYAVAFGDSCAGMVGKFLGRIRPAFLHGKSIEGSLACYAVTFFSTYLVLNNVAAALICACAATIAELMPAADVDNILIPLAVGFAASIPSVCLWTI